VNMLTRGGGMMDAVVNFHVLSESYWYTAAHHHNHKRRADDLIGRHPKPCLQQVSPHGLQRGEASVRVFKRCKKVRKMINHNG
jgi:hypothetical protein